MSSRSETEVVYPESDGQPMAENTLQFRYIVLIKEGLEILFADREDVFIAGDLFWYPVEGQPGVRAAPDAMVVFGRPKGDRGSYRQFDEDHIAPQVVFEVLSPSNTPSEMAQKLAFYDRHGVEEYYIYDPDRGTLEGYQRKKKKLANIEKMQGWTSPRLEVRFEIRGRDLVLFDPEGQMFRSPVELASLRKHAEEEAQLERERRAKAENERAKAESEREKAESEREKAESEREKAESEREKAEDGRAKAEVEREKAEKARERERKKREKAEHQMAEEKRLREEAMQQAQRLREQLRALGIDPDSTLSS